MNSTLIDLSNKDKGDYKITYRGPGDRAPTWNLATPHAAERKNQPVLLLDQGTEAFGHAPGLTTRSTVNNYGEEYIAHTITAAEGTLKVLIGAPGYDLAAVDRNWRAAWDYFPPKNKGPQTAHPTQSGRFTVVHTGAQNRWCPVFLTGITDVPHNFRSQISYPCEVNWKALSGLWYGNTTRYGEGTHTTHIPGQVNAAAYLRWDTSVNTKLTLPSGLTINLSSTTPATRYFNLERGYLGQPTDPDGNVDSYLWSTLRGQLITPPLAPGNTYTWTLGPGLELAITPRYFTPWR